MTITPKLSKLFRKGEEFADIYGFWSVDEEQNSRVHQFGQGKEPENFRPLFKMWCSHKPIINEICSNYQIRGGKDESVLSVDVKRVNALEFETERGIETIFEVYFT